MHSFVVFTNKKTAYKPSLLFSVDIHRVLSQKKSLIKEVLLKLPLWAGL